MIINIKDILTLDDNNEYVVISKVKHNNKDYYYLIDKNNNKNIKFCYGDNDELVEIENKELITLLLPLFVNSISEELSSEEN